MSKVVIFLFLLLALLSVVKSEREIKEVQELKMLPNMSKTIDLGASFCLLFQLSRIQDGEAGCEVELITEDFLSVKSINVSSNEIIKKCYYTFPRYQLKIFNGLDTEQEIKLTIFDPYTDNIITVNTLFVIVFTGPFTLLSVVIFIRAYLQKKKLE